MVEVVENYRKNVLETFRGYRCMAEKALEQVNDDEFFRQLDDESNSIAIIVKHISGNQASRFTDFLTTDGEKAERDRDSEFIIDNNARDRLMKDWENGWGTLFAAIEELKNEDFGLSVAIRGEPHTVVEAINRQLTHCAYHVGQIVFLAKHHRCTDWQTVSVPRNRSADFNEFLARKKAKGEAPSHPLDGPGEFMHRKG